MVDDLTASRCVGGHLQSGMSQLQARAVVAGHEKAQQLVPDVVVIGACAPACSKQACARAVFDVDF